MSETVIILTNLKLNHKMSHCINFKIKFSNTAPSRGIGKKSTGIGA